MTTDQVRFWLNDRLVQERDVPGTTTLLRYLRDRRHLTGTKEGCAEGDCGACSVAILEERQGAEPTWRAVNSCLLFLPMLQGKRVYTVEALREREGADPAGGLHPVQRALVARRASQCGYCTPGIAMSMFEACYRGDMGADWQIDDQLCGNLCRCTGYRPIREAAREVAGLRPQDRFAAEARQYRPGSCELDLRTHDLHGGPQQYLQPTSLAALLEARAAHPEAVLVAGGTDLALEVTKRHRHLPIVIGLEGVEELRRIEEDEAGFTVGAGVNLTRVLEVLGPAFPALRKHLRVFGSRQIRSRATLGGNLMTASPIGDTAPLLVALEALAVVAGPGGSREVPLADFFTGYRQTVVGADEVLAAVRLPRPSPDTFVSAYKVSKRRELDISTAAAGMAVRLDGDRVAHVVLAYGGMAPKAAARARHAEAALLGGPWTLEAVEAAAGELARDFRPIDDLRGSARYRGLLARNLLVGFFVESTGGTIGADDPEPVGTVAASVEAK